MSSGKPWALAASLALEKWAYERTEKREQRKRKEERGKRS